MNETQLAWRVGIVVICAAVILVILIMLFGDTGWRSQYTVFVDTPTAPNVTVNTPVRKNGIRIGRVAAVENRDRSVLLTLKISSEESIYSSEICRIGTASFLGDALLEFGPGNDPDRGEAIKDRMSILPANVVVERNPVDLIVGLETQVSETLDSIKQASDTVTDAGSEIQGVASQVQDAFQDENSDFKQFMANARELSTKAESAIDNFNTFMVNINEFAGDPEMRENIAAAIRSLPELLDEVNATVTDTRETINGFRDVAVSAEENLSNLTAFTESLGTDGPDLIANLNSSLAKIESLVTDIGTFADGLGNTEGSAYKFFNDPELYNNLNETVRNARDISEQLRPLVIQLQPLMNDIRYTVDGLARDPGQLGLRGALDRSPAFGKFKGTVTNPPRSANRYLPTNQRR